MPIRLSSLHFKIASGVIATILLISAAEFAADYLSTRRQLLAELEDSADQLAGVAHQSLLELAMIGQHPELLQPAIERLAENSPVERILLLDLSGEVHFASDRADLGRRLTVDQEGCRNCHGASGQLKRSIFVGVDGREMLRHVSPVPNRAECHACHGPADRYNGVLVIDFNTGGIWARLRNDFFGSLFRVGLTVLVTLIVLGVLMNKLVILPLGKLTRATALLREGAESAELATLASSDEIGLLGKSFSAMAQQVQRSIQDLRSQQAYLQNLMDSLPDGLIVVDRRFQVEMTNHAADRIWTSDRLRLLPAEEFPFPEIGRALRKTFEKGDLTTTEIQLESDGERHKNAPTACFEIHCSPLRNSDGRIEKAILLVRDVTQRKLFQAQASRADRLATVGQLAVGVAHEINNPMAAITTCVEGLSRHVTASKKIRLADKREINDYLSTVGEAAQRCKEITERLLGASVERSPGRFEEVDLHQVVHEAATLVEHQARRQGVTITRPESNGFVVAGNRKSLSQLLLNLLLNGLEATPHGGKIQVSLSRRDDFVQLRVGDNGCGIPQEDLERIFDPFFTTKTESRGTGLGLSISQWIVRQHRGRMHVESKPGQGACFSVLLPEFREETQ